MQITVPNPMSGHLTRLADKGFEIEVLVANDACLLVATKQPIVVFIHGDALVIVCTDGSDEFFRGPSAVDDAIAFAFKAV